MYLTYPNEHLVMLNSSARNSHFNIELNDKLHYRGVTYKQTQKYCGYVVIFIFAPRTSVNTYKMDKNDNKEQFFKFLTLKLNSKLQPANERGCKLWDGCNSKYAKMLVQFPGNEKKTYYSHRLVYMCSVLELDLSEEMEVSHLCHNTRCCSIEHLSLEPHYINCERVDCKKTGTCTGHESYANCKV